MKQIVIVDNHNFFAESLNNFLSKFSKKLSFSLKPVKIFNSGKDVLEFLKNNKIDIVLIDFNMPDLNGIETSKLIKNSNKEVKIILYSIYDFKFQEKPIFIDAILKKDEIFDKLIPVIDHLF